MCLEQVLVVQDRLHSLLFTDIQHSYLGLDTHSLFHQVSQNSNKYFPAWQNVNERVSCIKSVGIVNNISEFP